MDNSKPISFSSIFSSSTGDNTEPGVTLTYSYLRNQGNTMDNLKTQITNQALELEQKKFMLALLKNEEKTYEELVQTLENEKNAKQQILTSLQQQVFDNRINFSDELVSFAASDVLVAGKEVLRLGSGVSTEFNIMGNTDNESLNSDEQDYEIHDVAELKWNSNLHDYTLRDEDDKIFEDIQYVEDPQPKGGKGKFIFKEPKSSK